VPENMPWVLLRRVGVGTRAALFEGALAGVRFWGRHHLGVGRRDLQRIDPPGVGCWRVAPLDKEHGNVIFVLIYGLHPRGLCHFLFCATACEACSNTLRGDAGFGVTNGTATSDVAHQFFVDSTPRQRTLGPPIAA
jgi:hypothetical protein